MKKNQKSKFKIQETLPIELCISRLHNSLFWQWRNWWDRGSSTALLTVLTGWHYDTPCRGLNSWLNLAVSYSWSMWRHTSQNNHKHVIQIYASVCLTQGKWFCPKLSCLLRWLHGLVVMCKICRLSKGEHLNPKIERDIHTIQFTT